MAQGSQMIGAWDPFRVWQGLFPWGGGGELERPSRRRSTQAFVPEFDAVETSDAYILKADLPGLRGEDLEVIVAGNQITVSGEREEDLSSDEDGRYDVSERHIGRFSRSFTLPESCDADRVEAELKNGVLTLEAPKNQPRRL